MCLTIYGGFLRMSKCNFESYEGDKNYIFISYAHKDSDIVYPIIEELNARGYRVWYDDGISPGSEWPEYIARHIDKCDTVLFFASPNSVASENCRREVNFTISRNKKFLSIIIAPTDFSLGMELQLSSYQSISKYEYTDDEGFYNKLFSSNIFGPSLLREPGEQANTKRVYDSSVDMDIAAHKKFEEAISDNNVTVDVPAPKSETVSASVNNDSVKKEKKSKSGKKIFFVLIPVAIILIVIILGIAGAFGVVTVNKLLNAEVQFSEYTSYSKDTTYVYLTNVDINAETVSKLNKLKNVNTIDFKNCTLSTDLNNYQYLGNIDSLSIDNCSGFAEYGFLKNMGSLEYLTVTNDSGFTDISGLSSNIFSIKVDNTGVSDISALADYPNLSSFSANNCPINSIPADLTIYASNIELSNCGLANVDFLNNSEGLFKVVLSNNDIDNFSFISINSSSLYSLDLSDTKLSNDVLDNIAICTGLRCLRLNNIQIDNTDFIKPLSDLTELSLSGCGIESIDGADLGKKTGLTDLNLSNNSLTTIPKLNNPDVYGFTVNVANNQLKSLDFISYDNISSLISYGNNIDYTDSATKKVLAMDSLNYVVIDYDDEIMNFPSLNECTRLYIIDCPTDKILEMNNTFTSSSLIISYSSEQIDTFIKEYSTEFYNWPN